MVSRLATCLAALAAVACTWCARAAPVLDNGQVRAELDADTGAIAALAAPSIPALRADAAPGEAFRLVLRAADRTLTTIVPQGRPRWENAAGRVTASWSGPLRDDAGTAHAISVRVTYGLEAGSLRVWVSLRSASPCTVLEVHYPALGGLMSLAADGSGAVTGSNPAVQRPLRLPFGDWSPSYPGGLPMAYAHVGGGPGTPGLYFGAHDPVARLKLLRVAQAGADVQARVVHLPGVKPGAPWSGSAAVYRPHRGGAAGSGRLYRAWFVRAFGIEDPRRDWLRRQSFFLMNMMMLPEGNINYRFADVPRLAAEAKRYGVTSVQLAGWQHGGHDNGYPYYEPDPRLGTRDDVRRALAACHRMGVRVYFFVNLQPAMLDLAWYRRELAAYESETESGDPLWVGWWGMGTLASRMALTAPKMGFLNPAFPRYADALAGYFRKLASVGADGIHVDKMFPAGMDANPRLQLGPDAASWEGAIRLLKRIERECRAIRPAFRISNECAWDRVLTVGTATWWAGNMTAVKAVFPETAETVGLYQPYDYAGVNNAVRSGWAVMVAPYAFQRSMHEPSWRGLSRYIRDVKVCRDRLEDAVFLGEGRPVTDVRFGPDRDSALQHSVFADPRTGRRTAVVTNGVTHGVTFTFAGFAGSRAQAVRLHHPGRPPEDIRLPAPVALAGERLVFVEELPAAVRGRQGRALAPPGPAPRAGVPAPIGNHDFEGGTLQGWTADPNWYVDNNAAGGWYSGWQGRWYAFSGGGGETRTGRLRSPVFTLNGTGVSLRVAGWADISGRTADRWNYVTLHAADGREMDRVYAPNTTAFTTVTLDGTGLRGRPVYIEAVDNGTAETFSMLCIDDVRVVDEPAAGARKVAPRADALVLQNAAYRIEVETRCGRIVRLRDRLAGVELIGEPRLADNWRFTVPRRGRESRHNYEANGIHGKGQRLTGYARLRDGLELRWGPVLHTDDGRAYPAAVTMRIALRDGGVRFELTVDNRGALEVGELFYPVLGGIEGYGTTRSAQRATQLLAPAGAGLATARPFHTFGSMSWLGVRGPELYYAYPNSLSMPWVALQSRRPARSLYFGVHDRVARLVVAHLEMFPGVAGGRPEGNWPRPDEAAGLPVGVKLSWAHLAYQRAGRLYTPGAVVLRSVAGSAPQCAEVYGAWLRAAFGAPRSRPRPAWVELGRTPFADLPAAARRAGAGAVLLTDWQPGGADGGVPALEPDPALGGVEGFSRASAECRAAGVRIYLQARLNPVSKRSALYRSVLSRWTALDRWGVPSSALGWGAPRTAAEGFTAGEMREHVEVGHPAYRAWLAGRLRRLSDAGAAGVHLLGLFGLALDFRPGADGPPGVAPWQGVLNTLEACRAAAPGLALVVDEPRDRLVVGPYAVPPAWPEGSPLRAAMVAAIGGG